MRADQARAYVETLLERLTGADKVQTDEDGDYPVVYQDLPYYVRVIGTEDPIVQVFSIARRVGRAHCCARPPSEPDVHVSAHPAQASPVA